MRSYASPAMLLSMSIIAIALGMIADSANAVDDKTIFEARFRNELAQVRKTRGTEDDAALAKVFIKAIDKEKPSDSLAIFILEQAVEFGSQHVSGFEDASDAIRRLMKRQPDRVLELRLKQADLFNKWYESRKDPDAGEAPTADQVIDLYVLIAREQFDNEDHADAMETYKTALAIAAKSQSPARAQVVGEMRDKKDRLERLADVEGLKKKLEANPKDRGSAKSISEIYVFEFDDPAGAAPYLEPLNDETFKTNVTIAAKELHDLEKEESLTLAQWYGTLGKDENNPNQVAMLIRSKMYYEQFLSKLSDREPGRRKIENNLRDVEQQLADRGIGMKAARRLVKKLRGEEDVTERDPKIAAAIDKGIEYLYSQYNRERHWEGVGQVNNNHAGGYTALVTYALLMADEDPRARDELSRAVYWLFTQDFNSTYTVCFRAHAWEILPDKGRYAKEIFDDSARITRVVNANGLLHYKLQRSAGADLSTTLGAYLTVWLAEISGSRTPHEPWQDVVEHLVDVQRSDGGWNYRMDPSENATGGMTAAGLTVLLMAIERRHLNGDLLLKAEAAIDRGFRWFDQNYNPKQNPNGGWKNYYLVAMQHAGLMSKRRTFGGRDWYKEAADDLVATQQANGSWTGRDPVSETAFAVIFLSRGGIHTEFTAANEFTNEGESGEKKPKYDFAE